MDTRVDCCISTHTHTILIALRFIRKLSKHFIRMLTFSPMITIDQITLK